MHSTRPRILVAGSGALGCVFGGFLAQAGYPVTLLGRPGVIDPIRAHGLTITGLWGDHHIDGMGLADSPERLIGPFDIILLCVKSWDTAAMAKGVAPLLADNGLLVSLQNGLGNIETITGIVGAHRTAGARVIFGAEITRPGTVNVTVYAAPVLIGTLSEPAPAPLAGNIDRLVGWLNHTPIPTEVTDGLHAALWAKVLYNAALNPLGALLGVTYGELAADAGTRQVMNQVIDEAFSVAEKLGVRLPWPTAEAYQATFYSQLVPPTAGHRSSMLQDLERGRPTEVDALSGRVVTEGHRLGLPCPVNAALAQMIRFKTGQNRSM